MLLRVLLVGALLSWAAVFVGVTAALGQESTTTSTVVDTTTTTLVSPPAEPSPSEPEDLLNDPAFVAAVLVVVLSCGLVCGRLLLGGL